MEIVILDAARGQMVRLDVSREGEWDVAADAIGNDCWTYRSQTPQP